MTRSNPAGDVPYIDKSAFIDPTALVIGKVSIGKNVFVGPYAVIRADEPGSEVIIEGHCNVQDRVVVHALQNTAVVINAATSLSHGCIIHGPCRIGEDSFVGFGSVVFRSTLGKKIYMGHLSLAIGVELPSGRMIPDGSRVGSVSDVKRLKAVGEKEMTFIAGIVQMNKRLVRGYKGFL